VQGDKLDTAMSSSTYMYQSVQVQNSSTFTHLLISGLINHKDLEVMEQVTLSIENTPIVLTSNKIKTLKV